MEALIGRGPELARLGELLDGCIAGRAGVALIEGEAGVGKSRLVEEVRARAAASELQILVASADELERSIPFAPLVETLDCRASSEDPERAAIAAMLQGGSASPFGETTAARLSPIVERLCALVEGIALEGPTLLIVEDLHWADRPTLVTLRAIARRFTDLPLVLLGTARPGHPDVERLFDNLPLTRVVLTTLTPQESVALTAALLGAPPGGRLQAKVESTGGNPLFIRELIRAMQADGLIAIDGGVADVAEDLLSASVRQSILRRLSDLSEDALEALRLASLLGTTFVASDLGALLAAGAREVDRRIREPLTSGVLLARGNRLVFRHDLVREAIYTDIPETVRRGLHREAADLLEQAGAPVIRTAEHLVRGAAVGDKAAIARLVEATRAVSFTDLETAAMLMRAATALYEPDDPDRDLHIDYFYDELVERAGPEGAVEILREKLSTPRRPDIEARLRGKLAWELTLLGRSEEALEQVERLMQIIQELPTHDRSIALQVGQSVAFHSRDWDRMERITDVGIETARRAGNHELPGELLFRTSWPRLNQGYLREALERAEAGAGVARVDRAAMAHFLLECDRIDEAFGCIRDVAERPEFALDSGATHWLALAVIQLQRCAWDDAAAEFEGILEAAVAMDKTGLGAPSLGLALIATARGRLAEADAHLDLVPRGDEWLGDCTLLHARMELLQARGEHERSLAEARTCWDGLRFYTPHVSRWFLPAAVRTAVDAGDAAFAARVVEHAEAVTDRAGPILSMEAMLERCYGLRDRDPDRLLTALEMLQRSGPRLYDQTLCREDAARALAAAGRLDEARPLFDTVIDTYESMAAEGLAARAAAAMRAAGLRRGARGKRGRPIAGWDSLTPTELTVVEHVTQGLRNVDVAERLFVSPHTVRTHLRHVFEKLGLSSRVELTKAYTERRV